MPMSIIRCKGIAWVNKDDKNMYIFEQAGKQKSLSNVGPWIISMSKQEQKEALMYNPEIAADWDEKLGDKMIKLVFIGKNMDKEQIIKDLDACLNK